MENRERQVADRRQNEDQAHNQRVRRDGTYLVTGGLGALGLRVAGWLAEQGAGTIALLARRAPAAAVDSALDAIRERGANVIVLQGDVADATSLQKALAALPNDAPPLRGVIHAAGVLADGIIAEMTLEQLDRAMAPKVRGGWNLHAATLGAPLDFFVLFSSVASVLGSPGQANYAAGNAYLDALAHARRAMGRPATAINWGPWAGSGMAAEAARSENVKSKGMALIEPGVGLELIAKVMDSDAAQVAVMDAQWHDMLRMLGSRRPALLANIADEVGEAGSPSAGSQVDHAFQRQLIEADAVSRQSLVEEYIRLELARIMGVEPGTLESDQPLSTFGLDSLLALELKNNLEGRLSFTLPMAKLMEGPSIASLAEETARLLVSGETLGGGAGEAARNEQWSPLLALRDEGNRPPLVLLPALGGDIRCYADLVQALDEEQPVYAFRPRGVDQDLPPHLTMDEMMADYLAALREWQPTGPYYLAGWSTGGIFAFALAKALEESGQTVALLSLFDTPLPSICDGIDVEDDARFVCDLLNFVNQFMGSDLRISYEELLMLEPEERFAKALGEARQRRMIPMETPDSFVRRLVAVGEANVRVIQSYVPQPLNVPIELFVPTDRSSLKEIAGREPAPDEDLGWQREVGQAVTLHEVPGDHFTMMLGSTAGKIARVLEQRLMSGAARMRPLGQPVGE
jgi:thioesterase domain-containing protein/NAD(P)-dependent dehydrogenase (short-subunit alcohol dehydrogenase family)/acyl carrier protein